MRSKVTKKSVFSWALYDFANSAFATTVMAGFFPVFFKEYWAYGSDVNVSTAQLGLANAFASVFICILAPILGTIADKGSLKKKFLMTFAFLGVLMTLGLYFVGKGNWPLAVLLYVIANIGFAGANVFYDSLITSVSDNKRMDFVSSLGYSLGYLGGGILFAFNVFMTLHPHLFGFATVSEAVSFSFITVAVWWFVFSLPVLLFVKEAKQGDSELSINVIKESFRQLRETFYEIRHMKMILLFLIAYWLYIDGVDTIVKMAVDYGMSIGFDSSSLLKALLLTQFIGFPSALFFGYLSSKISGKKAILIAIFIYFLICIGGAFVYEIYHFYILAGVIGFVQGGIQALSRSFYAKIIPAHKAGEYFGFYNMLGKFAAILGPVIIGVSSMTLNYYGFSDQIAARISISSVAILFVLGGIIFAFVDEDKAKKDLKRL